MAAAGVRAHSAEVSMRDVPVLARQLHRNCVAGLRLGQRQLHADHTGF